jgi:hypothetical protein
VTRAPAVQKQRNGGDFGSYIEVLGWGSTCSDARSMSGVTAGEGSSDITLARRAAEEQGLTSGLAHCNSVSFDLFE